MGEGWGGGFLSIGASSGKAMSAVQFDTHKFVRRLRDAGFPENQAEALVLAFQEVETLSPRDLVHTEDQFDYKIELVRKEIKELDVSLRKEIELVRTELKKDIELVGKEVQIARVESQRDIAKAKAELIRWVVGVGILQSSLIVGVLLKVARLI